MSKLDAIEISGISPITFEAADESRESDQMLRSILKFESVHKVFFDVRIASSSDCAYLTILKPWSF